MILVTSGGGGFGEGLSDYAGWGGGGEDSSSQKRTRHLLSVINHNAGIIELCYFNCKMNGSFSKQF